jgi:hypothetical protein
MKEKVMKTTLKDEQRGLLLHPGKTNPSLPAHALAKRTRACLYTPLAKRTRACLHTPLAKRTRACVHTPLAKRTRACLHTSLAKRTQALPAPGVGRAKMMLTKRTRGVTAGLDMPARIIG